MKCHRNFQNCSFHKWLFLTQKRSYQYIILCGGFNKNAVSGIIYKQLGKKSSYLT